MPQTDLQALFLVLAVMNAAAFAAMGIDKAQALRGGRRISERTLFLLAVFGGAPGGLLGMHVFHHKTLHTAFRLGFPALLLLQLALLGRILWKG